MYNLNRSWFGKARHGLLRRALARFGTAGMEVTTCKKLG
jgi:hypothetical protein